MTYEDKKNLCKEINGCPIYQNISHGAVCACSKDIYDAERLEVYHPDSPFRFQSKPCNEWEEDYIAEWIISVTIQMNDFLSAEDE